MLGPALCAPPVARWLGAGTPPEVAVCDSPRGRGEAQVRLPVPVEAVATANITLSGSTTIDGVALAAGDRVLFTGQTTASGNGLGIVAAAAWTRGTDADANGGLVNGTVVYVTDGTA